jgi:hypothetical protein
MMFLRQDIFPGVDILRIVVNIQKKSGNAVFGGLIINDYGDTQWEKDYEGNFLNVFLTFRDKIGLVTSTDDIYIHLKRSKIIKRGKHLDWSFREEFRDTAEQLAAAVQTQHKVTVGAL